MSEQSFNETILVAMLLIEQGKAREAQRVLASALPFKIDVDKERSPLTALEGAYLLLLKSFRPHERLHMQLELSALRDAIAEAIGASPEDVQNDFEGRANNQ